MDNEVTGCLYAFDCVVVVVQVEVCLELCTRRCEVPVRGRLGGRSEDERPWTTRTNVKYISGIEGNVVIALKNNSERLTQPGHLSLTKSYRFAGLAIDRFLLANSVYWGTPHRAGQLRGLPSHNPSRLWLWSLDASFSGVQMGRFPLEWVEHNPAVMRVWHANSRTKIGRLFKVGAKTTQGATH